MSFRVVKDSSRCSATFAYLGVAAPGSSAAPKTGRAVRTMSADRCQIWARLATTATPGQAAEALVAGARRRGRTVTALGEILLFLHTKEALLLLDTLAVDAAAANSTIHAKTSARATNT